jgi:hypothetical protein
MEQKENIVKLSPRKNDVTRCVVRQENNAGRLRICRHQPFAVGRSARVARKRHRRASSP